MTDRLRIALMPDGGRAVGLGHLARSVALAQALTHLGEHPVLVPPPGAARGWLASVAVRTAPLGRRRWDLLVVDSYRTTRARLDRLREACHFLAVVDDLGRMRVPAPADLILRLRPGRATSGRIVGGTPYVSLRRDTGGRGP